LPGFFLSFVGRRFSCPCKQGGRAAVQGHAGGAIELGCRLPEAALDRTAGESYIDISPDERTCPVTPSNSPEAARRMRKKFGGVVDGRGRVCYSGRVPKTGWLFEN
jgi:hypothetical protein